MYDYEWRKNDSKLREPDQSELIYSVVVCVADKIVVLVFVFISSENIAIDVRGSFRFLFMGLMLRNYLTDPCKEMKTHDFASTETPVSFFLLFVIEIFHAMPHLDI